MRILLLEDDRATALSIEAMLRKLGHQTDWFQNGPEALDHLRGNPMPDLVLTDILMPGMDGLEVIRNLRNLSPHMPIIAMTSQSSTTFLKAAVVFGAESAISKPLTMETLREALERVEPGGNLGPQRTSTRDDG